MRMKATLFVFPITCARNDSNEVRAGSVVLQMWSGRFVVVIREKGRPAVKPLPALHTR